MTSRDEIESLRRQVNRLRSRTHENPSAVDTSLVARLIEAERQLETHLANARKEQRAEASFVRPMKSMSMGATTTGIEATISLRMGKIPTSIVHLLDAASTPLVEVRVEATTDVKRVRVTSYVEGYSAKSTDTIEVDPAEAKTILQMPTFFPARTKQVDELTRATLHVKVDDLESKRAELHRSIPIWLVPRTTAYLTMADPSTGEAVDVLRYLGAWVTPNAPDVMEVLREAAGGQDEGMIVGYQGAAQDMESTVRGQLRAIYKALRARDIRYVNSVIALGAEGETFAQRVRLPRESLANKSANCIDGTVLMAALLEAASLNAAIVLVPGHAFVGVELSEGSGSWTYVETTMLGSHDFEDAEKSGVATAKAYDAEGKLRRLEITRLRLDGVIPME